MHIYNEKSETMGTEIIVAFITGILGPVFVFLVKNYYTNRRKKRDFLKNEIHSSDLVNHKLEEIREESKSDRVWITRFHNGGTFYPTGKSIAKFSVVHEIVGPSVSSIQSNFQNIPVSLFSKCLNQLLENNYILIPDYKDVTVATYGLKYVAEETGCKSNYLFAIKTIDGKFVGVLGLDFTKKKVSLNEEQIGLLKAESYALGGVLNKD